MSREVSAIDDRRPESSVRVAGALDDDRLGRNAAALVVAALVTSGLGFVFWVLAARLLDEEQLGVSAGLVAAVVLLGNASALGLRNALQRFLPLAGTRTRHMIVRAYAAVTLAGVLLGSLFVSLSGWIAPDLAMIRAGFAGPFTFVLAVVTWSVFVLQDNVLIGLRRASWVPVENSIYSLAKLVALLSVATWSHWGLLVAWTAPALALIGPLNWGIFTRLIPRSANPPGDSTSSPLTGRVIARFAGGDHLADTIAFLGAEGVVLVVLARIGPEATAPLFVAITIAAALRVLGSNVMSAFLAEASSRPDDASLLLWRSAVRVGVLVVPAALAGAALAPIALDLYGGDYDQTATPVLRLLLLGAISAAVIDIYVSWLRFHRRMVALVWLAAVEAVVPLAAAFALSPSIGIASVGWGVLVGHGLLAVAILLGPLRAPLLEPTRDRCIAIAASCRRSVRQRRRERAAATLLDELDVGRSAHDSLLPRTSIPTETDVSVSRVGGGRSVIVKVALSRDGDAGLLAHEHAVRAMRATASDAARSLVPAVVESGTVMGQRFVVETACSGSSRDDSDAKTLAAVATAMTSLHRATARPLRRLDQLGYHVVYAPVQALLGDSRLHGHHHRIAEVGDLLERALIAHDVMTARTHGDLWLGNVLFDSGSVAPVVSGFVDWESSVEIGLPEVDLAHLWLSVRAGGMADRVRSSLGPGRFVDLAGPCGVGAINADLPAALVVPLGWLAHVADGVRRSSRFGVSGLWCEENVARVLDVFDECDLRSLLAAGSAAPLIH